MCGLNKVYPENGVLIVEEVERPQIDHYLETQHQRVHARLQDEWHRRADQRLIDWLEKDLEQ